MMETIDLLIIGAGPAGLSTAMHLLQQNPSWAGRMLLLEKAKHPRPKLCGGGVTRLGLGYLRDLGFQLPLPIPQARVDDVRLQYGSRLIHSRGQPQFVVFHRPELDAHLAEVARQRGAVICEDEPALTIDSDADGVTVTTSRKVYRSKAVVAADGSKGISRQVLGRGERRRRVARLLETLCAAPESAPHFGERYALMDFTPTKEGLQGYCWDFPARLSNETFLAMPSGQARSSLEPILASSLQQMQLDGLPVFNRGVYDARLNTRSQRAHLPQLLDKFFLANGGKLSDVVLEGHPIHWFSPLNRFAWPRLLLVGDSAGVDSLFGEGIAPALGYGQVAAQTIQRAFATGDFSFPDYRRRLLNSTVGRYLLQRWSVAEVCYRMGGRRWFMHLVWTIGDILAHLWPELPELYEKR